MNDPDMKFNFLTAAISDVQETIRFIDSKAAFSTIVVGGMLALLFSDYEAICRNYCPSSWYAKIMLWVTLTGILVCIYCLIKVIVPVHKSYNDETIPKFHLKSSQNILTKFHPKKKEILPSIETYQKQIRVAEDKNIINSLTCELYAVSYIREVKSQRLSNLLIALIITSGIFIATYVLFK